MIPCTPTDFSYIPPPFSIPPSLQFFWMFQEQSNLRTFALAISSAKGALS
jgi:hypothetical protein